MNNENAPQEESTPKEQPASSEGKPTVQETLKVAFEHQERLLILFDCLGSKAYHEIPHLHNGISDAMERYYNILKSKQ